MNKFLYFAYYILLNLYLFINGVLCQSSVGARGWMGCSLVKTTIYCYGGFSAYTNFAGGDYNNALDEHIYLDLSDFKDFSNYRYAQVQWKPVSNQTTKTPFSSRSLLGSRARIASVPVLSKDVYLIYGGWINFNNMSSLPFPFQAYDASTSVWNNLPLPPGSNYSSGTNLVNLGNDTIWVWGGTLNSSESSIKNVLNTFDYKTSQWTTQIVGNWAVRESHTTTLARNGLIYILGGLFKTRVPNYEYARFSDVISFNTQSSQWSFINATNDQPTKRRAHTTTPIPNTDLLLVYGGMLNYQASGIQPIEDNCILFNTSDNSLKIINLPSAPNVPNDRYGHFATIYQSDLLVLAFGFVNSNVAANDLRILNVSDPLNPTWLINNQNDSSGGASGNNGMSKGQMIGTIIAVIVVSLVAAFSGWFFYIRYRRRQQRKEFTLQQEDPRKNFDNNENFELNELDENLSNTYVIPNQQVQYTKLFENTDNDQHNTTASTKPFEDSAVNKVKPFENQMN